MKNKFKAKHFIIIATLSLINLALIILLYILNLSGNIKFDGYYYLISFIGAMLLFIGWVIPNHTSYQYRRETKNYNGPLPDEIKEKIFNTRFPLMTSGLICLIISMIFSFF